MSRTLPGILGAFAPFYSTTMLVLTRSTRFSINPPGTQTPADRDPNGYAASPSLRGLGRFYQIDTRCRGTPDPAIGYLIDIKAIDKAVHAAAVPIIARAARETPAIDPAQLLPELTRAITAALPSCQSIRWHLSPYYSVEMATQAAEPSTARHNSSAAPAVALIRQRFDFSASHRLHVAAMSDEENRAAFGKCNHPSGHGHNYQVEPCVAVPLTDAGPALSLDALERLTDRLIIQRFDHKYLNQDTAEFRTGSGLNPTVENIAKVCFDLLAPAVAREGRGAALRSITVWETDRTSCTYPT